MYEPWLSAVKNSELADVSRFISKRWVPIDLHFVTSDWLSFALRPFSMPRFKLRAGPDWTDLRDLAVNADNHPFRVDSDLLECDLVIRIKQFKGEDGQLKADTEVTACVQNCKCALINFVRRAAISQRIQTPCRCNCKVASRNLKRQMT